MDADLMLRATCVAAVTALTALVPASAQAQGMQPDAQAKMMENANESAQADADFQLQIIPATAPAASPAATGAAWHEGYGEQPETRTQEGRRRIAPCADTRVCGGEAGH